MSYNYKGRPILNSFMNISNFVFFEKRSTEASSFWLTVMVSRGGWHWSCRTLPNRTCQNRKGRTKSSFLTDVLSFFAIDWHIRSCIFWWHLWNLLLIMIMAYEIFRFLQLVLHMSVTVYTNIMKCEFFQS